MQHDRSVAGARYTLVALMGLLALPCAAAGAAPAASAAATTVQVNVDAHAAGTAFPHFWEEMFGSGRAVLALRDDYRADLSQVKRATNFTYIRAHGILDGEVGVFHLDKKGRPVSIRLRNPWGVDGAGHDGADDGYVTITAAQMLKNMSGVVVAHA